MKRFIPHLTICLGLMTLTFFVIDRFNEFMAFMTSDLSKWVFAALALCAIITSVYLIIDNFREQEKKERREARKRRLEELQDE